MITELKEWFIVSIYENAFSESQYEGSVLWGIVLNDETMRFSLGDYVCSSLIKNINQDKNQILTKTGSSYLLVDKGCEAQIYLNEFPLLRRGFNPDEIKRMRES